MIRGLLIVLITMLALIATVVGVVRAGMHRIALAQQQADANWHPEPAPVPTPATAPAIPAADVQEPIPTFDSIDLFAKDATLHGALQLTEPKGKTRDIQPTKEGRALIHWQQREAMGGRMSMSYMGGFHGADDYAEWPVKVTKPGDYEIDLTYGCPEWEKGGHFTIKIGDKELAMETESTRHETAFHVVPIGKVTLPAGAMTLSIRGAPVSVKSRCFMNLRSVEIIPVPAASGSN